MFEVAAGEDDPPDAVEPQEDDETVENRTRRRPASDLVHQPEVGDVEGQDVRDRDAERGVSADRLFAADGDDTGFFLRRRISGVAAAEDEDIGRAALLDDGPDEMARPQGDVVVVGRIERRALARPPARKNDLQAASADAPVEIDEFHQKTRTGFFSRLSRASSMAGVESLQRETR